MKFFANKKYSPLKKDETEIMTLKSGDCIGELDLFSDKNIKYSAVAVDDCDLWYLDLDAMKKNFYVMLYNIAIYS